MGDIRKGPLTDQPSGCRLRKSSAVKEVMMNNSFWTWIIVAGAVAFGLLLLLAGSPPPEPTPPVGEAAVDSQMSYYEPVLPSAAKLPYPPCAAPVQAPSLVGGCSGPVVSCPPPPPVAFGPPRINRTGILCIDECSLVQLHTTIPQPIPGCIRFEWLAGRGSFLDPTASDPIYYAPSTDLPRGEDVWIVLIVTDPAGVEYTDRVMVHVRNVR